jgi:hypothetical protein
MWGSALWFKGSSRQERHGNREGAAVSNRTSKASLARSTVEYKTHTSNHTPRANSKNERR